MIMWHIKEHRKLDKIIEKLPLQVVKKYELWKDIVTVYVIDITPHDYKGVAK